MSRTKEELGQVQSQLPALTIRQPWAWLIIHGGKDVENRTWGTDYRGDVLIHSSKKLTKKAYKLCCEWVADEVSPDIVIPDYADLDYGGIIGRVTLSRVILPDLARPDPYDEEDSPWYTGDYGFVFGGARPLPFIECRGQLGFWDVPPAVLKQVLQHG